MDNSFNYKKAIIFTVCLCVVGFFLVTGVTWSYFYKNGSYDISGQVINWSFKADGNVSSFTKNLGDILPGDTGSFILSLDASSSTTDVDCFVTPDVPFSLSGIKLYSDSSYTTLITDDEPLEQVVAAGGVSSVTIYWLWEFDTGLLSTNGISFSVNVVGKQMASS